MVISKLIHAFVEGNHRISSVKIIDGTISPFNYIVVLFIRIFDTLYPLYINKKSNKIGFKRCCIHPLVRTSCGIKECVWDSSPEIKTWTRHYWGDQSINCICVYESEPSSLISKVNPRGIYERRVLCMILSPVVMVLWNKLLY